MRKHCLLFAVVGFVMLAACSSEKRGAAGEAASPATEMTESQKMIDASAEQINMNPQNSGEYCESKGKIQSLDKLASTPDDRAYVVKKQEALLETLKRFVDDITLREGKDYISDMQIKEAAQSQMWKDYNGWEIVTFEETSRSVSNNKGIYTVTVNYSATAKKSNGIFRKDDFRNQRLRGIGKYILTCKGADPVSYTMQYLK